MQKVLILGSSGLLGKKIFILLKKNKNLKVYHSGLKKRKFDFLNKTKLKKLIYQTNVNVIINTIGLTNIEKCETNSKTSKKLILKLLKKFFE